MIKTETFNLFYKKYPYRIKVNNVGHLRYVAVDDDDDDDYNKHYQKMEELNKDIRAAHKNIDLYLKKCGVDYKTRTEMYRVYFIEDRECFEFICKTYADVIYEKTVPFRSDLAEVNKKLPVNTEIRKYLYFGTYRFKMIISVDNIHNCTDASQSVTDVMNNLNIAENGKWIPHDFMHYGPTNIYFDTYDQVSYAALMFQNVKIKKIHEAILKEETYLI